MMGRCSVEFLDFLAFLEFLLQLCFATHSSSPNTTTGISASPI